MSIRLVTFDLDDTLWDNRPVIRQAEASMLEWLARHSRHLEPQPLERLTALRRQLLERQPELRHRVSELRRRVLRQALLDAGHPAAEATGLAEGAFQAMLEARHRITPFDDTLPTLRQLAGHYQLGVITNGNADVRRLGLAEHFQFALRAEELGIGKPDPLPFHTALRHAGVGAGQAVHVGDNPDDDIRGARLAGLRAIWFNPGGLAWDGDDHPEAQIARLAQLPELLRRWRD